MMTTFAVCRCDTLPCNGSEIPDTKDQLHEISAIDRRATRAHGLDLPVARHCPSHGRALANSSQLLHGFPRPGAAGVGDDFIPRPSRAAVERRAVRHVR